MKYTLLRAALAALLLPLAAFAADAGQLVDVVATGHGSTVREATKAALRAAVEQVVGTMVDATTLVENDELIEDEILQYSAGMVESSKTIGEPKKSADGFYTVKVKATVKKRQVEEKLRTASAVNVTLDGADLFARMIAAQNNLADAEAMIKDVLAKHLACVVAEAVPGENGNSPLDLDPKTGEVFANVRVRIDQAKYQQFAKEVMDKLGPMANKKVEFVGKEITYFTFGGDVKCWQFRPENVNYRQNLLLLVENIRTMDAHILFFEKNKFDAIHESFLAGKFPEIGTRLAVRVTLFDSASNILSKKEYWLPNEDLALCGRLKWYKNSDSTVCAIAPFCGGKFDSGGDFYKDDCWTDRTFRISLGTFSAEELKSAGKLDVRVGHMKDGQFTE